MVLTIYKEALAKLMEKPFKLWGLSLLYVLLVSVGSTLFGIIPGVAIAIGVLFETAMALIFLRGYRGEKIETLQLFDCFRDWPTAKRVLCGMGWMLLWIFIWSLIPFVGPIFGLIRTYEYRLTPYILMQEPEVKATDAIKLSKQRTEGWKGKMFLADILIYVGVWLAILILLAFARIRFIGWIFGLAAFLLFVAFCLFITLFLGLVKSAFYEKICGREKDAGYDAPVPPRPAPAAAPVAEEPVVVAEPVVAEPVVAEPVVAEPVVEAPAVEEPAVEEPAVEEPAVEEKDPEA